MNDLPVTDLDARLRDLINRACELTARARRARIDLIMIRARSIGYTLHAARDTLDQIGLEYADAAAAYISAGARQLDGIESEVERAEIVAAHADRVTAHDVLAWIEHHHIGIPGLLLREIESHT